MDFSKVILNAGKDLSPRRFHPWIFSGAINKIEGEVQEGDVVEVYSDKNEYLGTGHCETGTIAVRLFSFEKVTPNQEFWKSKIETAYQYRRHIDLVNNPETNTFRLVYGEGDGLPGLIIDCYNGTAVLQAHTVGMYLAKNDIALALKEVVGDSLKAVYDKSAETLPKGSGMEAQNGYLNISSPGDKSENQGEKSVLTDINIVNENGHQFYVDWESGQKTGFFIDQRENRELLAKYSKGKNVLNTFCYTGGFSVYALKAGANLVHSVDSSKKAIELTDKNIQLNFPGTTRHESFATDTFDFMNGKDHMYDIIILDPPAFAKNRNSTHNALMGYKRLNTEAIKQLKPGGLLFTFSCSGVIDRNMFNGIIMSAAIVAGRKARILHRLSQPPDHPVNIFHPEGEYLKGLVLQVE